MIKLTLSEARHRAKIPRRELAKRLGISIYSLDYYMTGRCAPRADIFLNFCKICGVDPYDIEIGGAKK